jgi:uncharacterized membrane protein
VLLFAFTLALMPALAPVALAAGTLKLTTPYPAVTVSPDNRVSFDLSIDTDVAARVELAVTGAPASWTAALHGGGFVVSAVETTGGDPTVVRLDVDVPKDATGTTHLVVTATGNSASAQLPLDIKVEAQAGGEVTITPDFLALKGSSSDTFTFNLNLKNGTEQDLTFTATGTAPAGWTIDAKPTGQTQAVTAIVKAGAAANIAVTVKAVAGAPADTYPIGVNIAVGPDQLKQDLSVEITGSFGIALSTPGDLLSAHGPSGSVTEQTFTITNSGTSPLTAVAMSATAPTNWKVEFDKATIESIAAGTTVNVIAKITPSGNAIAGDYSITFNARAKEASDSVDVRFTVETSIVGGILGGALIVAAVVGLWWVFRRYGRR